MVEEVRVEKVTRPDHIQDCGCGCGGVDCGAGRQEVVLVGISKAPAKEVIAGQCECGCECCS